MSTLSQFIDLANRDAPVYLSAVRDAFQREGARRFHYHVRLYDGSVRRFALRLPDGETRKAQAFLAEYLNAHLYNALSALGAREIIVYVDPADAGLSAYAGRLDDIFQTALPLDARRGYGRCLNVNERTLRALCGPDARFRFRVEDISTEPIEAPSPENRSASDPVFERLPKRAGRGLLLGMDVGGTDIKLAASVNGRLCALKEYDWNPARCDRVEQIIEPMLLLARLMRATACMGAEGLGHAVPRNVFDRTATDGEITSACASMEAVLDDRLRGFDGIGLCFPDVVIRDRVIGGETPKTQGLRANPDRDYEAQFARLSGLCDALGAFAAPGAPVKCVNDGPMAAFTAAVETAAAGRPPRVGCFAHSLGTDLGTGWVLPDGGIPELPLELYNLIIDLGSRAQRAYGASDIRSVNNFNTGLPGTLQRCASQSGVFRLAARRLPCEDPALFARAIERGLIREVDGGLFIPASPVDMRKPCLEYFMGAAPTHPACAEVFREVGETLGVAWRETEYILAPGCASRTLFGRLVKQPECFALMLEGARRVVPGIDLVPADDALAATPLMRDLAGDPVHTVAQFGQAVGAIHYACTGMTD